VYSSPENARLVVVVLNWNRYQDTIDCVCALQRQTLEGFATIIVDNGSRDGSAQHLRDRFPDIRIICNERNLGYAGGNNVGIRAALEMGADYVLLLNNDTVPGEDFLEKLLNGALADKNIAAAGPKVLWAVDPPRLWGAYVTITYHQNIVRVEGFTCADVAAFSEPADVDCVIGCGILMSRTVIENVGLLDEEYFAYHEDVDWCYRARKKGYRVVYVPEAVLLHKGSKSTGGGYTSPIMYFAGRNSVLFAKKHATFPQLMKFAFYLTGDLLRGFVRALFRRPSQGYGLKFRGMIDGIRGNPPPLAELGLI
jgi:GT2 family glycosyltransferase